MGRIQLKAVQNSQYSKGERNGRNDLFFATDMYGKAFGHDTLALTTWWYRDDELVEADIGFNQAKRWDSYRGTTKPGLVYDLRRVALHELGHVLGLGHPDDHGQSVVAMMNSTIGNLDSLTTDDIAGIQEIYGAPGSGTGGSTGGTGGGTGAAIGFPPRNETYEFRNWLESKYVNTLGRPAGLSYSDVEGSVVWVQEYLRYRLNLCSHEQSVERVRIQIAGGGVPGGVRHAGVDVCHRVPAPRPDLRVPPPARGVLSRRPCPRGGEDERGRRRRRRLDPGVPALPAERLHACPVAREGDRADRRPGRSARVQVRPAPR